MHSNNAEGKYLRGSEKADEAIDWLHTFFREANPSIDFHKKTPEDVRELAASYCRFIQKYIGENFKRK